MPSTKDSQVPVELSNLQDINVSDDMITGTVMFRSLGRDGKNADDADNKPTRVKFETIRTIRNEAEDQAADGVVGGQRRDLG